MKRYGKITLVALVMLLASIFTLWFLHVPELVFAAPTTYTNVFLFKNVGNLDYTHPEIVFVEIPSGNVANKTTGVAAASEHWEDNDITPVQHGESDFYTFKTPPLASNKEWLMCICNAVSAGGSVETDTMVCFVYSPATNRTTSGELASTGGGLYTRPTPTE